MSTDTVKVTFSLPGKLQREYKSKVVNDGYGMRGKSRWIVEAVDRLLNNENFVTLVKINEELTGLDKTETIVISEQLKDRLNRACVAIRTEYPLFGGVQSCIFRTAIIQRLLRETPLLAPEL